jgi:predicted acylesterase/phospholipase RssA
MDEPEPEPRKIRHLVLSGGGEIGICFFGALKSSNQDGFWRIEDIKTIYATSAGSLFGTITALTPFVSWEMLDVFFEKRPWEQVFDVNVDCVLSSVANCGILGRRTASEFLSPVLRAADLSIDVTMSEFFDATGIEMHYMATNLDAFELVDISYKSHPNWKVVDAVYASCALPIMFQPIRIEGVLYADGAIFCNFPIKQCLAQADHPDEILAFQKVDIEKQATAEATDAAKAGMTRINENMDSVPESVPDPETPNLLTYLGNILTKLLYSVSREKDHGFLVRHIVRFPSNCTTVFDIYRSAAEYSYRLQLMQLGIDKWTEFKRTLEISSSTD